MRISIFILLLTSPLFAGRCLAQSLYATVSGSVTDPSGAVIPGATVDIVRQETGDHFTASSNGSGLYTLSTVPAGTYSLRISKPGFSAFSVKNVNVVVNAEVRIDGHLSVGSETQEIQVSATQAELQADRSDVHTNISAKELTELPQATRTYEGLIGLIPGVTPPKTIANSTINPTGSFIVESNGSYGNTATVRVDGLNSTNPWIEFFSVAVPSTDAIETVNVVTATSGADQAFTGGAGINVQLKSGSNKFHGSGYFYHSDNTAKARPRFAPPGYVLPALLTNNPGGTIGGPVLHDKLFFFASYEYEYDKSGGSNTLLVPTDDIRRGDFSAYSTKIYNPSTGTTNGVGRSQFSGNVIPAGDLSTITQKLIALIPEPNLSTTTQGQNNYYVNTPLTNGLHKVDTKIEYVASDKLRTFGHFSVYPFSNTAVPVYGQTLGGSGNNPYTNGKVYAYSVSAIYSARPNLVFDGLFGETHTYIKQGAVQDNVRYGSDVLGIPGVNIGPFPTAGGVPQFNVNGYTGYGYNNSPVVYQDPIFEYQGNGTWILGNHNIRFGIDVSQQHVNQAELATPTAFGFSGGSTSLNQGANSASPNQLNSFADFLLGLPSNAVTSSISGGAAQLNRWLFDFYINDQWQVTPKLTASIGTGWEYYPLPNRGNREIEYYDFGLKQYQICGEAQTSHNCGMTTEKTNFAPRAGLAYRVLSKTVIRAGYTLSPEQVSNYRDAIYNYPVDLTGSFSGPDSYTAYRPISQGIPLISSVDISSGVLSLPAGVTFHTLPKHFKRGYSQTYDLFVEQQLPDGWLVNMGYVGEHGVKLLTRDNANYATIGGGAASQPFNNGTYNSGTYSTTGANTLLDSRSSTNYNSLQVSGRRAFTNGYSVQAAYTWSKAFQSCCDLYGISEVVAPAIAQPNLYYLNRALAPQDRTHNLQLASVYELPFGPGKTLVNRGPAAFIIGGWQLNGILSAFSGSRFSVSAPDTNLNDQGSDLQRANQIKPTVSIYHGIGNGHPWFDTTAFAAPTKPGEIGNSAYFNFKGPGYINLDLGLFRSFHIYERLSLQTRAELLNASNTPHFSNPSGSVTDSNFGIVSSTTAVGRSADERHLRLGVKLQF